ncbi:MAG: hypothetical protein HPY45_09950 [Anaerolineae bacterium]|nr:hypothetical protein [Anaerolineae bacterium]
MTESVFNLRKIRDAGLSSLLEAKALYFVALETPEKKAAMKIHDWRTLQRLERMGLIEGDNGKWRATEEGLRVLWHVMKRKENAGR